MKLINLKDDISNDEKLDRAKGLFKSFIILGVDGEGDCCYFFDSSMSNYQALWVVENFKQDLLEGEFNSE